MIFFRHLFSFYPLPDSVVLPCFFSLVPVSSDIFCYIDSYFVLDSSFCPFSDYIYSAVSYVDFPASSLILDTVLFPLKPNKSHHKFKNSK